MIRSFFLPEKTNSPSVPVSVSPGGSLMDLTTLGRFLFWPWWARRGIMAELDFKKLNEFCAAILEIQKNPKAMKILSGYLRIAGKAKEERLTPEGMARFEELNAFIVNTVHE